MTDKPSIPRTVDEVLTPRTRDKLKEIDDPVLLRRFADWLDELADHVEEEQSESAPEYTYRDKGLPDPNDLGYYRDDFGAPDNAVFTMKTIKGNEYYYFQWETEDGSQTSKYVAPKDDS